MRGTSQDVQQSRAAAHRCSESRQMSLARYLQRREGAMNLLGNGKVCLSKRGCPVTLCEADVQRERVIEVFRTQD